MTLGPKLPKLCLAVVLSLNREGAYRDSTLGFNDHCAPGESRGVQGVQGVRGVQGMGVSVKLKD